MEKLHQLAGYLKEFEKIDGAAFARFMSGKATIEELAQEGRAAAQVAREKQEALAKRIAAEETRREEPRVPHPGHQPPIEPQDAPAVGEPAAPGEVKQEPGSTPSEPQVRQEPPEEQSPRE